MDVDQTPLRVLHVDDSPQMRHWLAVAVGEAQDLVVVGSAEDGRQGVEMATQLRPDVIVLDQQMPTLDGLDALPLILRAVPHARVVMWCNDPLIRDRALELGAAEFVAKGDPLEQLLQALRPRQGE
jgi:two-component system, chemotaxis family, protein-glutamate methylesterase/glutaminase